MTHLWEDVDIPLQQILVPLIVDLLLSQPVLIGFIQESKIIVNKICRLQQNHKRT